MLLDRCIDGNIKQATTAPSVGLSAFKGVTNLMTPTLGGIGGVNLPKHRPPHRIGGGGGSDGGNVGAFRAFSGVFSVKVLFYTYIDGKRQKRGNYGALLGASMYIVKPIQKNTGGGRWRNPRPYRWGCIVKD